MNTITVTSYNMREGYYMYEAEYDVAVTATQYAELQNHPGFTRLIDSFYAECTEIFDGGEGQSYITFAYKENFWGSNSTNECLKPYFILGAQYTSRVDADAKVYIRFARKDIEAAIEHNRRIDKLLNQLAEGGS